MEGRNKKSERERMDLNLEDIKGFQGMVRVQRESMRVHACEREREKEGRHRESVRVCTLGWRILRDLRAR